jgi:hypothetical protein
LQGIYKRAIEVGNVKLGVTCNNRDIIYDKNYFDYGAVRTLLSDFPSLNDIEFTNKIDGYMNIIDDSSLPLKVCHNGEVINVTGDFTYLEKFTKDLRFSLFGNLGLFSRFVMMLGEMKHDEYSFHATAMYDEEQNRLIITMGKAAAGKSTCLLAGINRGYKVISTERVIFKIVDNDVIFMRGSTLDNVWNTNLHYDFPQLIKKFDVNIPEPDGKFGQRVGIDFKSVAYEKTEVINPEVIILLPLLQIDNIEPNFRLVNDKTVIKKNLYDNAGNKLDQLFLLYDKIAVPPIESAELAQKRLEAVEKMIEYGNITKVIKVISGPSNCLDGLDMDKQIGALKEEYS